MLGLCQLKKKFQLIDKGQAWIETGIENKRFVCVVKSERERQLHVAVLIITMILSRVRKILLKWIHIKENKSRQLVILVSCCVWVFVLVVFLQTKGWKETGKGMPGKLKLWKKRNEASVRNIAIQLVILWIGDVWLAVPMDLFRKMATGRAHGATFRSRGADSESCHLICILRAADGSNF